LGGGANKIRPKLHFSPAVTIQRLFLFLIFLFSVHLNSAFAQVLTGTKAFVGFNISFREYHTIGDTNDVEPLDWYYLVNTRDEQHHEWRIDTANQLTMFFESSQECNDLNILTRNPSLPTIASIGPDPSEIPPTGGPVEGKRIVYYLHGLGGDEGT